MRKRLTTLAMQHGYNIIDGHCKGKKHKSTVKYIKEANIMNDYFTSVVYVVKTTCKSCFRIRTNKN